MVKFYFPLLTIKLIFAIFGFTFNLIFTLLGFTFHQFISSNPVSFDSVFAFYSPSFFSLLFLPFLLQIKQSLNLCLFFLLLNLFLYPFLFLLILFLYPFLFLLILFQLKQSFFLCFMLSVLSLSQVIQPFSLFLFFLQLSLLLYPFFPL